jgi:oligopeptide/dipeptide ABC transporter ATP-binding protein
VHFQLRGRLGQRGAVARAVDGVSLTIGRGETLGLVGESGSGKSTLAKAIVRLVRATGGHAYFDSVDILGASPRTMLTLRPRIQLIFQDSLNSLNPHRTVGFTVSEPLIVHRLVPRQDVRARTEELFRTVGMSPQLIGRRPAELSGGQRQRVNIARALASGPDLLIADEPTSALDVSVQAQILTMLAELQSSMNLSLLFISHDLGVVRRMSSRVAVMYLGKVVEEAPRDQLYSQPRHPYSSALLETVPRPDPAWAREHARAPIPGEAPSPVAPPPGCRFHPRCFMARETCATEEPVIREISSGHRVACHFAEELGADHTLSAAG